LAGSSGGFEALAGGAGKDVFCTRGGTFTTSASHPVKRKTAISKVGNGYVDDRTAEFLEYRGNHDGSAAEGKAFGYHSFQPNFLAAPNCDSRNFAGLVPWRAVILTRIGLSAERKTTMGRSADLTTTYSIVLTLRAAKLLPPARFFPIVLEFAAPDSDN
jgi:hypothetical protein